MSAREEAVTGTTIADCACIVRDTRTGAVARSADTNGVVVVAFRKHSTDVRVGDISSRRKWHLA